MVSHQIQNMFNFRNKKRHQKSLGRLGSPVSRCQKCSVCGDRGQCEVQLNWAWQPLAAKMSTSATDLVYWTPPLYNSNITEAASNVAISTETTIQPDGTLPQQRSVRKKKLSSSRRRTKHIEVDNNMGDEGITESSTSNQPVESGPLQRSTRRRKLSSSRRRVRLAADNSFSEDMEDITESESPIYNTNITETNITETNITETNITETNITETIITETTNTENTNTDTTNTETNMETTIQPVVSATKQGSVRKKKLSSSRRRAKLLAENSITEEMKEENNSKTLPDYCDWGNQDNNEIGINEEPIVISHENDSIVTSLKVENSSKTDKEISSIDKDILTHNNLIHNTPVVSKYNSNKPKKLSSSPTLFKLIEKFSNLHVLPGIMQKKNKNNEIMNEPKKCSNKRNKRPSIKVYQGHTPRSSVRSNSSVRYKKLTSNQNDINRIAEPLLSSKLSIKHIKSLQAQCQETKPGLFEMSDTENEDTISNIENLRSAQLKTMLHILAQVYEKKLTNQHTEMQHLRTHIQTQEKLMLQLVHVTMNIKGDLDKVKNNQKLGDEFKSVNEKLKVIEQLNNAQISNGNYNTIVSIGESKQIAPKNNDNVLTIKCGEFNC